MEFSAWSPWIDRIRKEFGYRESDDREAAKILDELLSEAQATTVVEYAGRLLAKARVTILGAADTADTELKAARATKPLITCDGATTAAKRVGHVPDIIVTDLDGPVEDQVWAAKKGSLVLVHAHGDNIQALKTWVPQFPRDRVAGTCQVRPVGRLINPGGFTDGDRAAFLAHALGARYIRLLGFNLAEHGIRFAARRDPEVRVKKLAWCDRLLRVLQDDLGARFDPPLGPPVSSATQAA